MPRPKRYKPTFNFGPIVLNTDRPLDPSDDPNEYGLCRAPADASYRLGVYEAVRYNDYLVGTTHLSFITKHLKASDQEAKLRADAWAQALQYTKEQLKAKGITRRKQWVMNSVDFLKPNGLRANVVLFV